MADLRALLIGVVGGIITYYATKGIDRYWARRTVRSRKRQINQLTEELDLLEKLGVADRALLLFAFKMLFPLIGFAATGVAGAMMFPFIYGPRNNPTPLILVMVSSAIAITSFYATSVFQKLEDPEPTLEKLRQKRSELQNMNNPTSAE